MIVSTMNDLPGYRVDAVFGEVMGVTVRARDAGSRFVAGLRAIGGGEISEMTQQLFDARLEAAQRMQQQAQQLGANAVLAVRYSASDIEQSWTELCCYGTAVGVVPIPAGEPGATKQGIAAAAGH